MSKKQHNVVIFTDGSSIGNPGPGGIGVVLLAGKHRKEIAKGYRLTTNNRMELLSVIIALEFLKFKNCTVTIFSDSKYIIEAINQKWVFNWEKKRFKNKKNQDLWLRFLEVYKKHEIKLNWIKGHAGTKENEYCDKLAKLAAVSKNLSIDEGYEASIIKQHKII